jgi:amino-acid N-acetyltransferase
MTTEVRNCDCVELRTARAADLPKVLDLLGTARLPTAGVAEAFSHFLVAESEHVLVGAAGLEIYGASALLRSVVVEDSWRRSGVGRRLIEKALDEAKRRGIDDVFLLTTTAEHYFPRFGFACVTRDSAAADVQASVEFQGACPSTAVLMRKRLKQDTS